MATRWRFSRLLWARKLASLFTFFLLSIPSRSHVKLAFQTCSSPTLSHRLPAVCPGFFFFVVSHSRRSFSSCCWSRSLRDCFDYSTIFSSFYYSFFEFCFVIALSSSFVWLADCQIVFGPKSCSRPHLVLRVFSGISLSSCNSFHSGCDSVDPHLPVSSLSCSLGSEPNDFLFVSAGDGFWVTRLISLPCLAFFLSRDSPAWFLNLRYK